MLTLGYNTTDQAVLVDEAGYVIAGRSWGPIDTLDPIARVELDALRVMKADEDAVAASDRTDAVDAVAALRARRARREAAEALSKDELLDRVNPTVADTLPVGGDDLPTKAALVEVVENDPTAAPPITTTDDGATSGSGSTTTTTSRKRGKTAGGTES